MEYPYNYEGLLNHHRGDGTNYLSISGEEYVNIWPTYDWQKIPGTTVLQKSQLPPAPEIQKDGLTDFVGAVTDGKYGAVGFDFISPHDFIKARKSWFFFEKEYVCLGAGIESTSRFPVVTTLEQSYLRGKIIVANDDHQNTLAEGEHQINQVNWIQHNNVGYIFPEPASIHVSNIEQSGSWFDINKQSTSSKELVSNDIFKLWIDHGVRPQGRRGGLNHQSMIAKDVKYQYIIVPNVKIEQMEDDRGIEVIANNRLVQAVKNNQLGISQIIFYQAGEIMIEEELSISIDSPGAIMLKIDNGQIEEITVADPSRKFSRLHMSITGEINSNGIDNIKCVYDKARNISELTINLPGGFYAGRSVNFEF
jgi:chondroitin AC lyase